MERCFGLQMEAGCDGIIVCGSLGEGPMLSLDEKLEVLKTAQGVAKGKPGAAHHQRGGHPRGRRILPQRRAAAGADGLMIVPSPIYHTNPEETVATLKAVAAAGGLPVMIYSNRIAYRVDVTVDIMAELADDPLFVAIKESCDDIRRSTEMINRFGDRFDLFTGVDNLAFEALAVGAVGWVAGLVCAFPRETVAIYRLMKQGRDSGSARHLSLVPAAARSRRVDLSRPEHQARRSACHRQQRSRAHAAPAAVRRTPQGGGEGDRGRDCGAAGAAAGLKEATVHRESIYSDAASEIESAAPTSNKSAVGLSMTADTDIVIIGAGIIGISVAAYLAESGHSVTVVDRTGICEETSSGNAAALAFSDVLPLAHKGMMRQLPKWLADPLGPLSIPPAYLPKLLPWLVRFWRAGWPDRYEAAFRRRPD